MTPQPQQEYIITDGIESHPQRCDNNCPNEGCYFHPKMGIKERGLDIDHPITIREFVRRFGCACYSRTSCPAPSPDYERKLSEMQSEIRRLTIKVDEEKQKVGKVQNDIIDKWESWLESAAMSRGFRDNAENIIKSLRYGVMNCPVCGVVICRCGKCHTIGCANEGKSLRNREVKEE